MTPLAINRTSNAQKLDRSTSKTNIPTSPHPASIVSPSLSVILPVPPSINHQYATVNGRRLLSSAGRAYKAQVSHDVWLAVAQSPDTHSLRDRLQFGPLTLSIRFFFASSLRRDLDGGLKIAQDAVCESLGINDNRIVEIHLYKHVDKTTPRIEVILSAVPQPPHST